MQSFSSTELLGTASWASLDYIAEEFPYRAGKILIGRSVHDYGKQIAVPITSHVTLCAETQTAKSRSIIIPNLLEWPGSVVAISSKPDLTEICATRRGTGDGHCQGLGQRLYVLDPLKTARVPEGLRAWFNPMDLIDENDLLRSASRLMENIAIIPGDSEAAEWVKRGVELLAMIAAHMKSCGKYKPAEMNLVRLYRLILAGRNDVQRILEKAKRDGNEKVAKMGVPSGITLLFKEMRKNQACDGLISDYADSLLKADAGHEEGAESVRMNALRSLKWLGDENMRKFVTGEGYSAEQRFDPKLIKSAPEGVSVFVNSSSRDHEFYASYEKLMFCALMDAHQDVAGQPATGTKTLFVVDEFLQYGRVERVETAMTEIASSGCLLFLSFQKLGALKKLYKENWETFTSGADTSLWFGPSEVEGSLKYLSDVCGEMHLDLRANQMGVTGSESIAEGETLTRTSGGSQGGSQSHAEGTGQQYTHSTSRGGGRSKGTGRSTNYRPGTILDFLPGVSNSHQSGRNTMYQRQKSRGRSSQVTDTQMANWSSTWQHSTAHQRTITRQKSISQTVIQQFNKRPLLSRDEARKHLGDFSHKPNDPRFPGLVLVLKRGEDPFVVRKSFYDMDEFFERKFTPSQDHQFLLASQQPMLEHMYTSEHEFDFGLPDQMIKAGFQLRPVKRALEQGEVRKGEIFAELIGPAPHAHIFNHRDELSISDASRLLPSQLTKLKGVRAPFDLTVLSTEWVNEDRQVRRFVARRKGRAPIAAKPCQTKCDELARDAKRHVQGLLQQKRAKDAARQAEQDAAERRREREARARSIEKVKGYIYAAVFLVGAIALFSE